MASLVIDAPSATQWQFLRDRHKYIAFGGARGGGKSWAVRTKAKGMALHYAGIKQLIVRRTYPELVNNHIRELRKDLYGIAQYNSQEKIFNFPNGSSIQFAYCAKDQDLDRLQGTEYDVIYLDEATQLSEYQIKAIMACLRGTGDYPKRMYLTCNPGGQGHGYIKRVFVDRRFNAGEDPDEYAFIRSRVTDNVALMEAQPDYIKQLESLPSKLRKAWLEGDWDIFEGQVFEDFVISEDEEARRTHRWTHVIEPFDIPKEWQIYRSYDFGYSKPFSCGWWAVDFDGVIYRILELYGCTGEPNTGVRWEPDKQFGEIARIEREHPWLKGKKIIGVADPAVWNGSMGTSVEEVARKHGVIFNKGVNDRISGWMQCHYRLAFDENGEAGMYVFDTCKAFIRTIPLLIYDEHAVEDIDTDLEDHVADEWRYMCMARPIKPRVTPKPIPLQDDPLNQIADLKKRTREQKSMKFY